MNVRQEEVLRTVRSKKKKKWTLFRKKVSSYLSDIEQNQVIIKYEILFFKMRYLVTLFLFLIYSRDVFAEYKVIKVRNSKEVIIRANDVDEFHEFLDKGDHLLLLGSNSKCFVTVLKVKGKKALVSTKKCRFKIKIGSKVIYSDLTSDDPNISRQISSNKDNEEQVQLHSRSNKVEDNNIEKEKRNIISPTNPLGEKESSPHSNLILKDSFYVGLLYIGSPKLKLKLNKLTANDGRDIKIGIKEEYKLKDILGVSMEYINFTNDRFLLSIGLDLMKKSEAFDNDDPFSIQPISLFVNAGRIFPMNSKTYLKLFLGSGLFDLKFNADGSKVDSSHALMYQFGIGIIKENLFVDLILRSMSSKSTLKLGDRYINGEVYYNVEGIIEHSIFEPMLRIGMSF